MMGCSIEPLELLSPGPMAESNRKEDIVVDGSTFGNWRKKKARKIESHKAQKKARESKEAIRQ